MKIYIIVGETGEYSDRDFWLVRAFVNKTQAREFLSGCEKDAKRWEITRKDDYSGYPNIDWSKFDPKMKMDYTGTSYFLEEVELQK